MKSEHSLILRDKSLCDSTVTRLATETLLVDIIEVSHIIYFSDCYYASILFVYVY